ncbi:MAG: sulfite exporter TauE/SafE family protein [Pirellulaceae bacterium]|nr:sulfite exporter TauE/SafE family protein [Pirellulaceae bacterium]
MDILQTEPILLLGLSCLGLIVGFLTGMFGIGGAFITTPIMILAFGIDPSVAICCSMGFTLVNGSLALKRHSGAGNFEPRAMWPIAIAASLGVLGGYQFHHDLKDAWGHEFDTLVNGIFCLLLLPIGLLVWWQSDKEQGKPLLSKIPLPPFVKLGQPEIPPISIPLLILIGGTIGILKGLTGIGGGIILVPVLVLMVGMTPHRAVGTSLAMVVLSSVIGTILFAVDGSIDLVVVLALLTGSLFGVVVGARFCNVLPAVQLKRLLALLIFCFSMFLAYEVFVELNAPTDTTEEKMPTAYLGSSASPIS